MATLNGPTTITQALDENVLHSVLQVLQEGQREAKLKPKQVCERS
jgi:hypothetical protein